jgi:hypothetical protein
LSDLTYLTRYAVIGALSSNYIKNPGTTAVGFYDAIKNVAGGTVSHDALSADNADSTL